jgi:hypothetical protein
MTLTAGGSQGPPAFSQLEDYTRSQRQRLRGVYQPGAARQTIYIKKGGCIKESQQS